MSENQTDTVKGLLGSARVPMWIDVERGENSSRGGWLKGVGPLRPSDVYRITRRGCGAAFTPAADHRTAQAAMKTWGDEIFDYLQRRLDWQPQFHGQWWAADAGLSWGAMAAHYVSTAVEQWAADAYDALLDLDGDDDEEFDGPEVEQAV